MLSCVWSGSRLAELDKIIQSVYEDKVAGRIEPDMAFDMLDRYQAEKKTLKAGYDEMNAVPNPKGRTRKMLRSSSAA